jgi:hypothetical protein
MILKLIKVVTIVFFVTAYMLLGLAAFVAEMESVPWTGY